jgi:tetratricopeptide (TPR) repeat protein
LTPFGDGLGISNLFWHDDPFTQAAAGIAVAALTVLLWVLSYLRHPMPAAWAAHAQETLRPRERFPWRVPAPPYPGLPATPPGRFRVVLVAMWLPLGVLVLCVAIARAIATPWDARWPGPWPLLLGAYGTVAATWLALARMPWVPRTPRPLLYGAAVLLLIGGAHAAALFEVMGGRVTAVVAFCMVLGEFSLILYLTHRRPLARVAAVMALFVSIAVTNSGLYKLRYPGLGAYYPPLATWYGGQPKPVKGAAASATPPPAPARKGAPAPASKEALEWADIVIRANSDREWFHKFLADQGDPGRSAYWIRQGVAFRMSRSRVDDAIAAFSEARRLDPSSDEARRLLARAYAGRAADQEVKGNPEAASESLGEAMRLAPDDSVVLEIRAGLLEARGDYGGAIDDELLARKRRTPSVPEDIIEKVGSIALARTRARRGLDRLKSENYAGAIEDLEFVINKLTSEAHIKNRANDGYTPPQELKELRSQSEAALNIAKLMLDGSVESEAKVAQLASVENPSPLALWALGTKRARRGALDEAIAAYSKAAERDPRDAFALEARATCKARMGDWAKAAYDRDRAARRRQRVAAVALATAKETARQTFPRGAAAGPTPASAYAAGRIDDLRALEAWRARYEGKRGPVLVVVATSGGGIAAAAWTVSCLSKIERKFPDFPTRIRTVFGASGGMVGAASYVATLPAPPVRRTKRQLDSLLANVAADSLTPVVRRMLLGDLPSILAWWDQSHDRGITLEETWKDRNPALREPMSGLAAGEHAGWRPSLVVSPMLVEDAAPLLISNLELKRLGGYEEFFQLYPGAHGQFSLSTALRMNAAFPLVSPGAYLPSVPRSSAFPEGRPPRRVVDAGYFDNYGVGLACAWIERHRGWLLANTSGVLLLQLRAYPIQPEPANGASIQSANPWQPVLTPIEGAGSARQRSMISRNEERVEQLRSWFNDETDWRPFFDTKLLQPDADRYAPPLGWSLTAADQNGLKSAICAIDVEPVVNLLRAE